MSTSERIERVVRLIRSKGVGVYFVTQNPQDIPDTVLSQLGNRVQHALRAFTPRDQKAVQSAADTMRPNAELDVAAAITELGVGEALVSCLDEKGRPCPTERVYVLPPASQMGPISQEQRSHLLTQSIVAGVYETTLDRKSAFEKLKGRAVQADNPNRQANDDSGGLWDSISSSLGGLLSGGGGRRTSIGEQLFKSAASSIGREVGRHIIRGVLGGILGRSKR